MPATMTYVSQEAYDRDLMLTLLGMVPVSCIAIVKVFLTQRNRKSLIPYMEDCLLLLSLLATYASFVIAAVISRRPDLSTQEWKYRLQDLAQGYHLALPYTILALLVHGLLRISFLISVRRLFSPLHRARSTRWVYNILLVLETVILISVVLLAIVTSPKISTQQSTAQQAAQTRGATLEAMIVICSVGLSTDTIVLLSPLPIVFELKRLSKRRMHQIICIIIFGLLTLSVSIARLEKLVKAQPTVEEDATEPYCTFIILSFVEITFATLTICTPTASVFFRWAYSDYTPRRSDRKRPSIRDLQDKPSLGLSTLNPPQPQQSNPLSTTDTNSTKFIKDVPFSILDETKHEPVTQQRWVPDEDTVWPNNNEIDDEDDDNFFELLVPSDHFFPVTTALNPRPSNVEVRQ